MQPTLDEAARQLDASPDHRVLRRVPPVERWAFPEATGEVVRAAVVDVEATGLTDADEVIELGIVPFDYDKATGKVVAVHMDKALGAFREPAVQINPEAQRVHKITSEMVAGKRIELEQVAAAMSGVQLAIAHHAEYDRQKLERHWPDVFEPLSFACSVNDVQWRFEGFETAALKWLLVSHGYFHEGHRAVDDAMATLFLLTMPVASGRPALSVLLENARKPLTLLQVDNFDFDHNSVLKGRGFRWKPVTARENGPKAWLLATSTPDAELELLRASVGWRPSTRSTLRAVPARLRYSSRVFGGAT